ncbi:MAG: type 4a pilus biogenesis protein PilO [Bdellovibrionaceae bacterium]|nr:type 4a pilus biogenesis protein PilO [Pseudobdellovibrionaceae bacterium]
MNLMVELEKLTMSRAVLVGILMAAIYYFTMYDGGERVMGQINTIKQTIVANKKVIADVERAIKTVEAFARKVEALGDKFEKLVKYIPEDFTAIDQMKLVSKQAKAAGTNIQQIGRGTEGEKLNFYQELNVNVNLVGTYTQIVLFLSYLTKLDKVLVMKEMNMSTLGSVKGGEPVKIRFSGRVTGYRYINEKADEAKR